MKDFRVLAVAAPQFESGSVGDYALTSRDPVSLHNACRVAAFASQNPKSAWAGSNLACSRPERRSLFLLPTSLDDMPGIESALTEIQPHLLLIGAMTICMPGAVAVAQLAKTLLGEDVCIVLGGRHPSETIAVIDNGLWHHTSSPLRMMASGIIPEVFDIVVAGEAEYLIERIGQVVFEAVSAGTPAARLKFALEKLDGAEGNWIAGAVDKGDIPYINGRTPLDKEKLPSPTEAFGASARFSCFPGTTTAHVFSDVGRGCIFDCHFCSERSSVTGAPQQLESSAKRLHRRLKSVVAVSRTDEPEGIPTAFCDDSTFLAGSARLMSHFTRLCEEDPLQLRFGAQLTIDQILRVRPLLGELKATGLSYLFVGVETPDEAQAQVMQKNVGRFRSPWVERVETTLACLSEVGITCGIALLFGLGESHSSRLWLGERLLEWRKQHTVPSTISLNWAVQHPLLGNDGGANYEYTRWAFPSGPYMQYFRDFGEASTEYPLQGISVPSLAEVRETHGAYKALWV